MMSLFPKISMFLFCIAVLGPSAASAAAMKLTGPTALAVAAVVAPYSPLLGKSEKKVIAGLFDGNATVESPQRKFSISADAVMCRISNVAIATRNCEIDFKNAKHSLTGREANEVYATLAAAGVTAQGAAGSMIEGVTKFDCTLDPDAIKQNDGSGAECSLQTDE